jgi:hypothetical protein
VGFLKASFAATAPPPPAETTFAAATAIAVMQNGHIARLLTSVPAYQGKFTNIPTSLYV